jgi:hypothetical protein
MPHGAASRTSTVQQHHLPHQLLRLRPNQAFKTAETNEMNRSKIGVIVDVETGYCRPIDP